MNADQLVTRGRSRRIMALGFLTVGLVAGACGGGSGGGEDNASRTAQGKTTDAPEPDRQESSEAPSKNPGDSHPCDLLSASEIEAGLGIAAKPGTREDQGVFSLCSWSLGDDTSVWGSVAEYASDAAADTALESQAAESPSAVPVAGLGRRALFTSGESNSDLTVLIDNVALVLHHANYSGGATASQAALTKLAEQALERM